MIKTTLILLIAGKSKRFAGKIKKQFIKVNNKPLFIYTLEAMLKFKFNNIIIVSSKKDFNNIKKEINKNILNSKNIYYVNGGKERVGPFGAAYWRYTYNGGESSRQTRAQDMFH